MLKRLGQCMKMMCCVYVSYVIQTKQCWQVGLGRVNVVPS